MTAREARDQRHVSPDFRMRCTLAAHRHKTQLSAPEIAALKTVTDAYAAMEFVTKADVDTAAGILGRLERDG
jgi:hypothetical protein